MTINCQKHSEFSMPDFESLYPLPSPPDGPAKFRLSPIHLVSGGDFPADPEYSACVYRLDDGFSPSTALRK